MTIESAALKIGFCGEVSSGKSTALQSILRHDFVPDFFGMENRPTIRIVLGAKEAAVGYFTSDGAFTAVDTMDQIELSEDITEIVAALTGTYGLGGPCELVEISPLRDGHVRNAQIAQAAECSVMVWTTIGSQAWRLSEKTILDEYSTLLPQTRILVATRADKFRSDDDRSKVEARLEKETNDYFSAGHLLGVAPKLYSTPEDEAAWADAGATEFVSLLARTLNEMRGDFLETTHEELPASQSGFRTGRPRSLDRLKRKLDQRFGDTRTETAPEEPVQDTEAAPVVQLVTAAEIESPPPIDAVAEPVADQAIEQPEEIVEEVPEKSPLEQLVSSARGLTALGVADADNPENVELIFGDADTVGQFAKFSTLSADTALTAAGLGNDAPHPENEQIMTSNHSVIYRVEDNKVLFLVGDASLLSAGIARTAFARFLDLYNADELAASEAA